MKKTVKIAAAQGFYGDSPAAAMQVVSEGAADYLVSDALAELTLSILQKDRLRDENMGYARDIEFLAKILYPAALSQGMKIVTNSGGLNPIGAVQKVSAILEKQGIKGVKIAAITGDNMIDRLDELQEGGEQLLHLDNNTPYSETKYEATHANVYTGAASVKEALDKGAQIILAGRVADPCLTLGILAHEFNWKIDDASGDELDLLASGICIGHLLECGGQASGGNSYAQWPMDYDIDNLGYPIAEVAADGSAEFYKLESAGGLLSRDTLREQLIYEIHDPSNYLTPDVTVDLRNVKLEAIENNRVKLSGVKGKPRPEKLKLTIGQNEGFISEQFFYFSRPYAYDKVTKYIDAVKKIWNRSPVQIEKQNISIIGLNGIHGEAAHEKSREELNNYNELGVRLAIKHSDVMTGKLAFSAITCLGLNGPPGIAGMPAWGKINRIQLSLWPTLIDRKWVKPELHFN